MFHSNHFMKSLSDQYQPTPLRIDHLHLLENSNKRSKNHKRNCLYHLEEAGYWLNRLEHKDRVRELEYYPQMKLSVSKLKVGDCNVATISRSNTLLVMSPLLLRRRRSALETRNKRKNDDLSLIGCFFCFFFVCLTITISRTCGTSSSRNMVWITSTWLGPFLALTERTQLSRFSKLDRNVVPANQNLAHDNKAKSKWIMPLQWTRNRKKISWPTDHDNPHSIVRWANTKASSNFSNWKLN